MIMTLEEIEDRMESIKVRIAKIQEQISYMSESDYISDDDEYILDILIHRRDCYQCEFDDLDKLRYRA